MLEELGFAEEPISAELAHRVAFESTFCQWPDQITVTLVPLELLRSIEQLFADEHLETE